MGSIREEGLEVGYIFSVEKGDPKMKGLGGLGGGRSQKKNASKGKDGIEPRSPPPMNKEEQHTLLLPFCSTCSWATICQALKIVLNCSKQIHVLTVLSHIHYPICGMRWESFAKKVFLKKKNPEAKKVLKEAVTL